MAQSTGPAPPPPLPRGRRWLLPACVAVVVVVIAVVALIATGWIHLGPTASANPDDETFSQALAVAQAGSSSVSGGSWYGAGAVAVVTTSSLLEPVTNVSTLLSALNCTGRWIGSPPANLAIPATAASVSVGASAFWAFVLKNASNGLLLETVSDGAATPLMTLGGTNCSEVAGLLSTFGPGIVDSPKVLSAVDAAGGSTFLQQHPNASQAWAVSAGATLGFISTSPEWIVEFTSCPLSLSISPGESGAILNATVGGYSGAVVNHSSGPIACGLGSIHLTEPSLIGGVAAALLGKAI
jgi:hypothetical protein